MRNYVRTATVAGLGLLAVCALLANDKQPRAAKPEAKLEAARTETGKPEADAGWVGVMLEEGKEGNVRIANVFPGGPAAFAGLRVGDALTHIGDTKVKSVEAAVQAVEALRPGAKETLTVERQGKPVPLPVSIGSLTEFHQHYVSEMAQRDPRDPNFAKFHGVRGTDMSIEVVRRLFEQNQRLENSLLKVLDELQALKKEVHDRKP